MDTCRESCWQQVMTTKVITGESQMLVSFQIFRRFTSIVYILFKQFARNCLSIWKIMNRFEIFFTWHCACPNVCYSTKHPLRFVQISIFLCVFFLCLAKGTNANSNWKIESELNNSKAIKIKWWCVGVGVHLNVLK